MRVILFNPRFSPLVATGRKRQTIRKRARCQPGDTLSLRRWTGRPRRSKHATIRDVTCSRVYQVRIMTDAVQIRRGNTTRMLTLREDLDAFARADGFGEWAEMRDWFNETYSLPFEGEVIEW